MRKRRPETRLNLQYDKLYVNNVAYVYNEDTEEVEMLNQAELETEYQVKLGTASQNVSITTLGDEDAWTKEKKDTAGYTKGTKKSALVKVVVCR